MAIWGPTAVAASADDGHVNESNSVYSNDLTIVSFQCDPGSSDSKFPHFRFLNIAVPAGATINSATLTVYFNSGGDNVDAANSIGTVYADVGTDRSNAVSDTHAVSPATGPMGNWVNSTASAQFSGISAGSFPITITSVVQELVNLGGWSSGDNACFAVDTEVNSVDTYWTVGAASYDSSSNIATLTIDYAEGGGGEVKGRMLILGVG